MKLLVNAMNIIKFAFTTAVIAGGVFTASCSFTNDAAASGQTSTITGETVKFTSFPKGKIAQMVRDLWMQDPEYKDYVTMFKAAPDFKMGEVDLNGDGTPEIFAKHSDSELGFCTDKGICRLQIYAVSNRGLNEIGRMMAGEPVLISSKTVHGSKGILVYGTDEKPHAYTWDGKIFKPQ